MSKKRKFINKKGSTLFILFAFILLSLSILGFTYDLCRILYYKTYLKNLATTTALSMVNRCHYVTSGIDSSASDRVGVIIINDTYRDVMAKEAANIHRVGNDMWSDEDKTKALKAAYDYYFQIETTKIPYYVTLEYARNGASGKNYTNIVIDGNNPDKYGTMIANQTLVPTNFNVVFAGKDYLETLLYLQQYNNQNTAMEIKKNVGSIPRFKNGKDFILDLDKSAVNRQLSITEEGMTTKMIDAYRIAYTEQEIVHQYGNIKNLNRYTHGKDGKNGEVEVYLKGYVKHFFLGYGMFANMKTYTPIYAIATAQSQVYVQNLSTVDKNTGNTIYD